MKKTLIIITIVALFSSCNNEQSIKEEKAKQLNDSVGVFIDSVSKFSLNQSKEFDKKILESKLNEIKHLEKAIEKLK